MKRIDRDLTATLAACALLLALALVSVCVGSFPLSVSQIGQILAGGLRDTLEGRVFWMLRVPRVAMGVLSGLALGLAGGVYQTIFRNPLASPDLTGVASGASFGAACAIVLGAGSTWQIMAGAFAAGMASLVAVLLLVRLSRTERTGTYILAGVIVASVAEAGLMVLKTVADPERELAAVEFWTMGSLASVTADKVLAVLPGALPPLLLLLLFRRQTAMLSLGEENARCMGLDPAAWRTALLSLTTLLVASVVSLTGVIAFAGLIAPHIAFLLARRRTGLYLPLCGLTGAVLIVAADVLARGLSPGAELPLSILTILFAVPLLALLLCGGKGERHGTDL